MATVGFDAMLDVVEIKNLVEDGKVRMTFDGKEYLWTEGEVKRMPRAHAEWFRAKSMFRLNPGDLNEGTTSIAEFKLAILGEGQDEKPITKAYVAGVHELLDVDHMPQLTRVDPKTGEPMRRVYIDPRSTGAMGKSDAQKRVDDTVRSEVSKAMISQGAEQIAEIAAKMPDDEFQSIVAELPQDASQAPQLGTSRRGGRA